MKTAEKIIAILLTAALLLALLSGCGGSPAAEKDGAAAQEESAAAEDSRRPENVFPAWWKVVDEPVHGVTPGTTLTLTGIDFDQPGFGVNDVRRDIIHIRAMIPGEDLVGHGMADHVEYLYEDEWYVVWEQNNVERMSFYPPGEQDIKIYIPAGLFQLEGRYRIYVDSLGYCEYENSMLSG